MVAVTNWAVEPEYSSEVLADELSTTISTHIATKGDINLLKKDIEVVRKDIENSENRLFGRLALAMIVIVGVWVSIVGVIVALLVLYFMG